MSAIRRKPKRHLMLFSGRAHPALAQAVAADLGTELVPTQAYTFANGEIYVRYEESVRGCDALLRPIWSCIGAAANCRRKCSRRD